MSKLASKLSKRIMATVLSVAMIMSNMTVYATEISDDPIPAEEIVMDEDMEIEDEAAEIVENVDEAAEVVENVDENTQDAEGVDELAYTEEESAEALYSVGDAEINENGEEIETHASASTTYDFTPSATTTVAGVEVTNFAQSASSHGFQSSAANATMKFTAGTAPVEGGAATTVDIDVLLCTYGASTGATMTSNVGTVVNWTVAEKEAAITTDTKTFAPKYSVLGVTGGTEVTLTFSSNTYVHKIVVTERESGKTYSTITVSDSDADNKVYVSTRHAANGDSITLTAVPKSGFSVKSWGVKDASNNDVATTGDGNVATFTMPSSDVTVDVVFEQAGTEKNIAISTDAITGGSVEAGSKTTAISNADVVIGDVAGYIADEGHHFKKWIVKEKTSSTPVDVTKNNIGQYVFTMPNDDVIISAEFEEDSTTTRTSWNFAKSNNADDTLFGVDNTIDYYIDSTGKVGGLDIDASANGAVFSTRGRYSSGYAQANKGTIIKVPVAGQSTVER